MTHVHMCQGGSRDTIGHKGTGGGRMGYGKREVLTPLSPLKVRAKDDGMSLGIKFYYTATTSITFLSHSMFCNYKQHGTKIMGSYSAILCILHCITMPTYNTILQVFTNSLGRLSNLTMPACNLTILFYSQPFDYIDSKGTTLSFSFLKSVA